MTRKHLAAAAVLFSATAQGSPEPYSVDLTCIGPSDDHESVYVTHVHEDDETEKPERVLLWALDPGDEWVLIGDYTTYDDLTPAPPTDVFYRYVFRDADAVDGDMSLMLMAGGFTQLATAQVLVVGEVDPPALATMNCREGPPD